MKKILYLLLLILMPAALAAENFNVYSKQLIDTCDCSKYNHEITISNIEEKAELILSSDYDWIQPVKFTLNKNEIRKITIPINIPCRIQGQYNLEISIKTNTSVKKIPLAINVKRCYNVEVKTDNYKEACPGKQLRYPVEIKNTGSFKEVYSFDLDKYKEYALIDYKALEIEPGKTANLNLYLNIPLTFEDNYNFTFITKTKYSKLTASTPLFFEALPCYKYILEYRNNYTLCQGVEEDIPADVKNLGPKQLISFKLSEEWASLSKDSIELNKDGQEIINIKAKPDRIGKDELVLESRNNIKKKKNIINLDVKSKRDCYEAEITAPKIIGNETIKIKNIGLREATYSLSIDSDWIKIPESISLAPEEEKEIKLDINWKEGKYNFNIKAMINDEQFVQSITVGEFVFHKKIGNFFVNLYNKIKNFIIKNKLYAAIAIGIIILLIIILKIISKVSEKRLEKELLEEPEAEKKEKKERKAEAKAEKKVKKKRELEFKFPWKVIFGIIIVIIAGLFYFIKTLRAYLLSYWLYIVIGIAVLFLLILFITLMSKVEVKTKRIKWIVTILVIVLILLFVYLNYPDIFKFKFDLSKITDKTTAVWDYVKNIFMPAYDFLYGYINYIILGFVILIILIFFINLLEKRKKKEGEEKEVKKEKKKSSKRKKK